MGLAKVFPDNNYFRLYGGLNPDNPFAANTASSILSKNANNYIRSTTEILIDWRNRTGGPRAVLEDALREIGEAGMIKALDMDL